MPMKRKVLWAIEILVPTVLIGFVFGLMLDLNQGERQTKITTPDIQLRPTQLPRGESHEGKDVRNLFISNPTTGSQPNSSTDEAPLTPKVFTGYGAYVKSIAISPDSRRLLSGGGYRDASVRLLHVQIGVEIRKVSGHSDNTDVIVAFTADPRVVLSAGGVDDFTVRFWNIESGVQIRTVKGGLESGIFQAISHDTRQALAIQLGGSHLGGGFSLWDLDRGRQVRQFSARGAAAFAFSPDGMTAVIGGDSDGSVSLWDLSKGRVTQTFAGHGKGELITSVATDQTGQRILSAGSDKTVRIWDARSGRELQRLIGQTAAAFSSDGSLIVSGAEDKTVRVWTLASGQETKRFEGHTARITAVAFAPDRRFVVSASDDRTIRLWPIP